MYKIIQEAGVITSTESLRSGIAEGNVRIVDARSVEEYGKGHIPTALNLPVRDVANWDDVEKVTGLAGYLGISNDDTPVVVYDDSFGMAAARVAWILEYTGHQNVSLLECQYSDWMKRGLESDDIVPNAALTKYQTRANPSMVATMQDIESINGSTVLVDTRRRLDFLTLHITGAVTVPHRALSSLGFVLRSRGELLRLFANRKIDSDSNVIAYDDSGTPSALLYYALKYAGVLKVRLYLASFAEWMAQNKPTSTQQNAAYGDLAA